MQLTRLNKNISIATIIIPVVLLILGIYHGFLQTLYRAGYIQSDSFLGLSYYQGLTIHGVVNAIVITTFFAVVFGNIVINYFLKKEVDGKLNLLSFSLMLIGTLLAAYAMLTNQASVLYTFYAPLKAHPTFYIGVTLLVVGSWVAFFSWIPLYLAWRREHTDQNTPLAVVGVFTTFIIWFLCTIPVAVEILVFLLPWSLGLTDGVNVLLTRTLFWFFGHPLVYFWLLPAYTLYYVMLPKLAGGKLYSDYAGRFVFMIFILLSIPLGVHHQFAEPGISSGYKDFQSFLTHLIAIPSLITAFNLASSLEYAGKKNGATGILGWMKKLPYANTDKYMFAYLISGLLIFILGGIGGIINASHGMSNVVHNTALIPGHFHLTVGGPVFLAIIGMNMFLLEGLTGKRVVSKRLHLTVPYLWMLGLLIMSTGMKLGGSMGEPRRTNLGLSYLNRSHELFTPEWVLTTGLAAVGGTILTISALIYFYCFFQMVFSKQVTEPSLVIPDSETYHESKSYNLVKNFKPWVIVAVILIVIAYYGPLKEAVTNSETNSLPYQPNNPSPEKIIIK